jgi:hypothetical protein
LFGGRVRRIIVMRPKTLDNPQRRRALEQLVRNAFPGCCAMFLEAPAGGVAFCIRAENGRYRSGVIKVPAHHGHVRFNSAWLARQIKIHGGSAAASPNPMSRRRLGLM